MANKKEVVDVRARNRNEQRRKSLGKVRRYKKCSMKRWKTKGLESPGTERVPRELESPVPSE